MPIATEIGMLRLLPGVDPTDVKSEGAQRLKKVYETLGQQKGFIRGYWGVEDEDPSMLAVIVDWEDVKDHQDFVNSDAFNAMTGELVNVLSFEHGPPLITHTNFTSDAVAARTTPITAVKSFKLPDGATDDQKSALEDAFLDLARYCITETACTSYACGWGLETLPNDSSPSGKAVSFNAMFGWPAREDYEELKDDEEFVEAMKRVLRLALPGPAEVKGASQSLDAFNFHLALHGFDED